MNIKSGEQRITISLANIFIILATGFVLVILWQLRSLIVLLMVSVVLAATIAPVVSWAERWRIPRWLAVVLVYLLIIAGMIGIVLLIGPTAFDQIVRLGSKAPAYTQKLTELFGSWPTSINEVLPDWLDLPQTESNSDWLREVFNVSDVQQLIALAIKSLRQLLLQSVSLTTGIVGGVFGLILSLFLSGYMVSDSKTLVRSATRLLPQPWDDRLAAQIGPASRRMGGYIRGRVLVSAILGVIITVSLRTLGLSDYALGLGAIAGVTNLIPFLGPVLGAIPALIVAVSQGWWTLLWVLILFIIIQNLETYILDPLLVGSSVGLHPLYQLLAVLGGTQVLGIFGALIVPPWIAGAAVLLDNLYLEPKLRAEHQAKLHASDLVETKSVSSDQPIPS